MTTFKSVVFSGHRDVKLEHVELLGAAVENACLTAAHFFIGGAAGADTLALMRICDLAQFEDKRVPTVWFVVPARIEDQPELAQFAAERAMNLFPDQFHIVEMRRSYNGESLKARNREMIDRAIALGNPELLAYFTKIWKSGTYSAMHYAGKKGVPITQIVP